MASDHFDLAVIGEGFAGLTCAARAAELGLTVATFERNVYGGLIMNVAELRDYADGRSGIDLATDLTEFNSARGVNSVAASVLAINDLSEGFEVVTDAARYTASAVVLATGASLNKLGVPGEDRLEGRGVSQCADCDGPLFAGQRVVVVGAGDSAFMEASALASHCSHVDILMRGSVPRARPDWVAEVRSLSNVRLVPDTRVIEICGAEGVDAVRVEMAGVEQTLECSGVFVYVGLRPSSDLAGTGPDPASDRRVETDEALCTARPGIYAIGAVRNGFGGTLADAERDARRAAEHAAGVLLAQKH